MTTQRAVFGWAAAGLLGLLLAVPAAAQTPSTGGTKSKPAVTGIAGSLPSLSTLMTEAMTEVDGLLANSPGVPPVIKFILTFLVFLQFFFEALAGVTGLPGGTG
jgi:hypothetical protein